LISIPTHCANPVYLHDRWRREGPVVEVPEMDGWAGGDFAGRRHRWDAGAATWSSDVVAGPGREEQERWIVQLADEDERIGSLLGVRLMTYSAMTCPITLGCGRYSCRGSPRNRPSSCGRSLPRWPATCCRERSGTSRRLRR